MMLRDALDSVIEKERQSGEKIAAARTKADAIRLKGEEEATEIYRKTRDSLKDRTKGYRDGWESRISKLEKELSAKLEKEEKKVDKSLSEKRKVAAESAYRFLVGGYERRP